MKKAIYTGLDGKKFTVEYDENAPCKMCGFPVRGASMAGTSICPWCDCGNERPEIAEARRKAENHGRTSAL